MWNVKWTTYLPICIPLALAACASSNQPSIDEQVQAANQKADQAMATAQQAMAQAQEANSKVDRQFQRGLQK